MYAIIVGAAAEDSCGAELWRRKSGYKKVPIFDYGTFIETENMPAGAQLRALLRQGPTLSQDQAFEIFDAVLLPENHVFLKNDKYFVTVFEKAKEFGSVIGSDWSDRNYTHRMLSARNMHPRL